MSWGLSWNFNCIFILNITPGFNVFVLHENNWKTGRETYSGLGFGATYTRDFTVCMNLWLLCIHISYVIKSHQLMYCFPCSLLHITMNLYQHFIIGCEHIFKCKKASYQMKYFIFYVCQPIERDTGSTLISKRIYICETYFIWWTHVRNACVECCYQPQEGRIVVNCFPTVVK